MTPEITNNKGMYMDMAIDVVKEKHIQMRDAEIMEFAEITDDYAIAIMDGKQIKVYFTETIAKMALDFMVGLVFGK